MAKRRYKKYVSRFADERTIVDTKVLKIEEQNIPYFDKEKNMNIFKSIFYCESPIGEPRMCVSWAKSNIQVGDTVQLSGRLKDEVFLVWSVIIMQRATEVNNV